MPTRSFVVIGADALRAVIKARLSRQPELQLVGEIGEGAGLWLLPELAPDVIVFDCAAPTLNSLVILPWLRGLPGAAQIIAVGASGSAAEQQFVLGLGADHYTTLETVAPVLLAQCPGRLSTPPLARAA